MWGIRAFVLVFAALLAAAAFSVSAYAAPSVSFEDPTPADMEMTAGDWIYVNVSASDAILNVSTFIDFDNSLLGWWRMDDVSQTEPGATVYDNSSYGNDGTAVGDANRTDSGYLGKGFEFDGADDYIDTNFVPDPRIESSTSYWIKISKNGSAACGAHDGANHRYYSGLWENSGLMYYFLGAGDTASNTINANIDFDVFHHVVATYNGSVAIYYFDGVQIVNTSYTSNAASSLDYWIGAQHTSGGADEDVNGTIDDLMIFNRSLSPAEVRALYANQTGQHVGKNFTNLPDWKYRFTAYAQDTGGSVSSTGQRTVMVGANIPQITVFSPISTTYYSSPVSLEWNVDRVHEWVGYSLNGAGNITLAEQAEKDKEDAASCSGNFAEACSNATDEDWSTYAECVSSGTCHVYENFTIPGKVEWANWTYKIYKIDGITAYSPYYWNYSSNSWSVLHTTGVSEGFYNPNVSIPSDGLSGPVLRIRNTIEYFGTRAQNYYEGRLEWRHASNTSIAPVKGSNSVVVYANDSTGVMGYTSVLFEYKPLISSIQLTLNIDNLANDVYVPGTGEIASASIVNTSYSSPDRWYVASYLNNVLSALVFSYQTPVLMMVNRTSAAHSLTLSQGIQNSRSFLVFSSGNWKTIDDRMGLIENREFMSKDSPSFAYGLGAERIIKILLSYGNIDIVDDLILQAGTHDIITENIGRSGAQVMLRVRSL